MEPDPNLIRAIEGAVEAGPANIDLRVHLAGLLIQAGRNDEALHHLEVVLETRPDHVEALGMAAGVGKVTGDMRASGWANLYGALSNLSTFVPSDGGVVNADADDALTSAGERISPTDANSGDPDWDGFLREVLTDAGRLEPITLKDVGGLDDVKARIQQSFLNPLRNPELRRAYGANLRGGLLLWGPPGCGKTFLARAVAGEMGAHFVSVGLHQILDMWMGNSEKQLHELFEMARRTSPCVLFFDELDAIGHSRIGLGKSAARNVVVQFLTELDGVDSSNEGIFVIGASNQPWDVDPALRRPGRFDRTVLVLPPDQRAREMILEFHLRNRPLGEMDFAALGRLSEGLSGADLRLVCEDATERAMEKAMRTSVVEPIEMADLTAALGSVRSSTGPWFESARNYVRYANESGDYDELAAYLRRRGPRRGSNGG